MPNKLYFVAKFICLFRGDKTETSQGALWREIPVLAAIYQLQVVRDKATAVMSEAREPCILDNALWRSYA